MSRVSRRKFLKASGIGAVVAKSGGIAGILATGQAPAYAQATTLHWLRWTDFVPASDQVLRNDIAKEAEKALGARLNIETINANDIQARITSAIQSGSGPDVSASSTTGDNSMARASQMSAALPKRSASPRAGFTKRLGPWPTTASNGSACRGA